MPTQNIGGAAKLDGYNIYSSTTLIASVTPDTLSYTYTGLTAGNSYDIRVSGFTSIGEGDKSLPSTFWAVNTPSAPTLSILDTSRDSCTIQWTAVSPPANSLIEGYIVMIDNGKGGDFSIAYNGRLNPSQF